MINIFSIIYSMGIQYQFNQVYNASFFDNINMIKINLLLTNKHINKPGFPKKTGFVTPNS